MARFLKSCAGGGEGEGEVLPGSGNPGQDSTFVRRSLVSKGFQRHLQQNKRSKHKKQANGKLEQTFVQSWVRRQLKG